MPRKTSYSNVKSQQIYILLPEYKVYQTRTESREVHLAVALDSNKKRCELGIIDQNNFIFFTNFMMPQSDLSDSLCELVFVIMCFINILQYCNPLLSLAWSRNLLEEK